MLDRPLEGVRVRGIAHAAGGVTVPSLIPGTLARKKTLWPLWTAREKRCGLSLPTRARGAQKNRLPTGRNSPKAGISPEVSAARGQPRLMRGSGATPPMGSLAGRVITAGVLAFCSPAVAR